MFRFYQIEALLSFVMKYLDTYASDFVPRIQTVRVYFDKKVVSVIRGNAIIKLLYVCRKQCRFALIFFASGVIGDLQMRRQIYLK